MSPPIFVEEIASYKKLSAFWKSMLPKKLREYLDELIALEPLEPGELTTEAETKVCKELVNASRQPWVRFLFPSFIAVFSNNRLFEAINTLYNGFVCGGSRCNMVTRFSLQTVQESEEPKEIAHELINYYNGLDFFGSESIALKKVTKSEEHFSKLFEALELHPNASLKKILIRYAPPLNDLKQLHRNGLLNRSIELSDALIRRISIGDLMQRNGAAPLNVTLYLVHLDQLGLLTIDTVNSAPLDVEYLDKALGLIQRAYPEFNTWHDKDYILEGLIREDSSQQHIYRRTMLVTAVKQLLGLAKDLAKMNLNILHKEGINKQIFDVIMSDEDPTHTIKVINDLKAHHLLDEKSIVLFFDCIKKGGELKMYSIVRTIERLLQSRNNDYDVIMSFLKCDDPVAFSNAIKDKPDEYINQFDAVTLQKIFKSKKPISDITEFLDRQEKRNDDPTPHNETSFGING